MVEPATLAAGAIVKIAFDEFVKAGAGEVAKKTVDSTIDLAKGLRDKIWAKFQGNQRAETALMQVEQDASQTALTKLEVYLDDVMGEDPTFAHEIQQMAQHISNIRNQNISTSNQQNINYGRDQNIFNHPQGDININRS
ncbi:MAG: hypothetical protein AB4372_12870 [Xenococcus sp. (in: cyanobacteria)]